MSSPTTLDVVFAAHTHMLLKLALPDPLVTAALDSYPRLVSHCHAVLSAAFPPNVPFPPTIQQNWLSSLRCLIPWPRTPSAHRATSAQASSPEAQQIERRYRLWRWGLIAGSVLATTGYIWFGVAMLLAQNGELAARLRAAASGEPAVEAAPEADDEDDEE